DIADAESERAAGAALAEHDVHDRHPEAGHQLNARSDRLRLPSLLGLGSGIRARCIHQCYERQVEFLREPIQAHRFAVPLWVRHSEVALNVFLGRRTLLLADDHDRPPVKLGDADGDVAVAIRGPARADDSIQHGQRSEAPAQVLTRDTERAQEERDALLELRARDDLIDETMLEQKLRALKTLGQLLANGLARHAS